MTKLNNIVPLNTTVLREDRERLLNQNSLVIWFTGLSGSGKSTLAKLLESSLYQRRYLTYLLDGDDVRKGLNDDLGFDDHSREENIRRIAETARLFQQAGIITIVSLISPFEKSRQIARRIIGEKSFVEVYLDCPIEICEKRDVKGLYKKARAGEILDFTGISSPYEVPAEPDLSLSTGQLQIQECLERLITFVLPKIIYKHTYGLTEKDNKQ